jgi:nucleoside-diphosphate-sugar epimerase
VRVLVLGGTRFIGPFAVRELAEAGHEVAVFHRGESEVELPARHVHGDFAQFDESLDELRAFEPEVVVDMIAVRPEHAQRVASFPGARHAVVPSSQDVYRAFGRLWRSEPGEPDALPLDEDSPLREVVLAEDYNKTALEAELRRLELPVTILRLAAVHGPGDYQHRLWSYLKRMDDGRPAILVDERMAGWRWTRGYVEDMAHAIALAAVHEAAETRVYNVADPETFTEREWIERVAAVTGWDGEVVAASPDALPDYLRQDTFDFRQDFVVDTSRIRSELGYAETVEVDEALRRTVEWERANPQRPEDQHPQFADRFDYEAEDAALKAV